MPKIKANKFIFRCNIAHEGVYRLGAENLPTWGLAQDELKHVLLPEAVLKEAALKFDGLPVILDHKEDIEIDDVVGICKGAWYDNGFIKSYLHIFDKDALAGIRDGTRRQISFGFDAIHDTRSAPAYSHAYDSRYRYIDPYYICLVSEGAGGEQCSVEILK